MTKHLPWAVLAVLLSTAPAHAANPYLEEARTKYKDLDYQAMPGILAEALLQRDIKKEEYVEIFRLQGFSYTVLGDQQKAREAFIRLLIVDSKHEMDTGVSPRFRSAFSKIKKEFETQGAVTITHVPASQPLPSQTGNAQDWGIPVEVRIRDAFGRVSQMDAEVRPVVCGKSGGWVRATLAGAGGVGEERVFKGKLPDPAASMPGDKPLGYYIEYRFAPRNMVNEGVDVAEGGKEFRVTVGSAAAASEPCKAPAAIVAAPVEGGGGGGGAGSVVKPILLGGVVAVGLAVGGVLVVALLAAAASGGTASGVAGYCYVSGACPPNNNSGGAARVTVTAKRSE